jgi:hypothetical protein
LNCSVVNAVVVRLFCWLVLCFSPLLPCPSFASLSLQTPSTRTTKKGKRKSNKHTKQRKYIYIYLFICFSLFFYISDGSSSLLLLFGKFYSSFSFSHSPFFVYTLGLPSPSFFFPFSGDHGGFGLRLIYITTIILLLAGHTAGTSFVLRRADSPHCPCHITFCCCCFALLWWFPGFVRPVFLLSLFLLRLRLLFSFWIRSPMSLYSLSSTLTWLTASDSDLAHHGPRQHNSVVPPRAYGDKVVLPTRADDDGHFSPPLSRLQSMGTTEREIGLYPDDAGTPAVVSRTQSDLNRNSTQAGVLYEFVAPPYQTNMDLGCYGGEGGSGVGGGATATTRTAAKLAATLTNDDTSSKKSISGDTATYRGSEKDSTVSSIKLPVENVLEENAATPTKSSLSALPPDSEDSVDNLQSSASLAAPSTELASTALRWRIKALPQPIYIAHQSYRPFSPLASLEADGRGNHYYFQPVLYSSDKALPPTKTTLPPPPPPLHSTKNKEGEDVEEHLVALPHCPLRHQRCPATPARPATCPAVRPHPLANAACHDVVRCPTGDGVDVAHRRSSSPVAEYMTPLSLVHNRRHAPLPATTQPSSLPVRKVRSSIPTIEVRAPAVATCLPSEAGGSDDNNEAGEEEVIVPTVIASNRLLLRRRRQPGALRHVAAQHRLKVPSSYLTSAALRGMKAMMVSVSVLRISTLESLTSVRTMHPGVRQAVFEAYFCEAPHSGAPPITAGIARLTADVTARTGNDSHDSCTQRATTTVMAGQALNSRIASSRRFCLESFSTVPTVVIPSPNELVARQPDALRDRGIPESMQRAFFPAPSAPQREVALRTKFSRCVSAVAAPKKEKTEMPHPQQQQLQKPVDGNVEADKPVNLRDLTRDIGREYELLSASFVEMLVAVPSAIPATAATRGVKVSTMSANASACGHLVSPCPALPPSSIPASRSHSSVAAAAAAADRITAPVEAAATAAVETPTADMSPFDAPLSAALLRTANPSFKRYPSHITPVSVPPTAAYARPPRIPSSDKAVVPVVTDTAPMPSKKFIPRSRLVTPPQQLPSSPSCTELKTPQTAEQQRPLPATTELKVSPIIAPATATIKPPQVRLPSPTDLPTSHNLCMSSIPMVRERRSCDPEPRRPQSPIRETALNGPPLKTAQESEAERGDHAAACSPALPPIAALQLALLPSDDISVLQTPRNDSPDDPSQPSPEWRDVPMPVLRRSLIARVAPECVRGGRVSASLLTVHPRHH